MNLPRIVMLLIFVSCLFGVNSQTRAGLLLSFAPEDVTIQVGESVGIDIFLGQTDPALLVDIAAVGLTNADIQLNLDSNAAMVSGVMFGTGFEDAFSDVSDPLMPLFSAQSISLDGVLAPAGSPTSILIGTLKLIGNSNGKLTITTVNTGFTEFVFKDLNLDIDDNIFGAESVTINVTGVPEPSSAALVALGVVALSTTRRRRK